MRKRRGCRLTREDIERRKHDNGKTTKLNYKSYGLATLRVSFLLFQPIYPFLAPQFLFHSRSRPCCASNLGLFLSSNAIAFRLYSSIHRSGPLHAGLRASATSCVFNMQDANRRQYEREMACFRRSDGMVASSAGDRCCETNKDEAEMTGTNGATRRRMENERNSREWR